jgi:hypothetical protein
MDYFAATDGTSGGDGSIGDPFDLQTALANVSMTTGDTLWLRGGTYYGKFTSILTGGTVRSYTGEWAIIDGNRTTTLTEAIGDDEDLDRTLTVGSTAGMVSGGTLAIEDTVVESVQISSVLSPTTVLVNRGWGIGQANDTDPVPHDSGVTLHFTGTQFTVSGSDTTYRDFEITNTYSTRDQDGLNYNKVLGIVGPAITNFAGVGNSFINIYSHDNAAGIFTGSSSGDTLIYGVLSVNEGLINPDNGQTLYLENATGYSRVYDVISLNGTNTNMQFRGVSGPYVGGDIQGCVLAGCGIHSLADPPYHRAMIYGPEAQQSPTGSVRDSVFHHHGVDTGEHCIFGYGSGIADGVFKDNYFLGNVAKGVSASDVVDALEFTGNKFDNPYYVGVNVGTHVQALPEEPGWTWDNNDYYRTTLGQWKFNIVGVAGDDFAAWKLATGYDANSSIHTDPMPDTVIVRANAYEAGRSNVVIYCPSEPATIDVDLSDTGLVDNQSITVYNAYNYEGDPVYTGTFDMADPIITIDLESAAAVAVATPAGMPAVATTAPTFFVFIVRGGESAEGAPGQPTGLTVQKVTNRKFNVTWTNADELETSVTLQRRVVGVTEWTDIPLAAAVELYVDTGVTKGVRYEYRVYTSNAEGDSLPSSIVTKTLTGSHPFNPAPTIAD